MVTWGELLSER